MSATKYRLLDTIKAQTKQGELELKPGQIITLPHDKAIKLLNEGKIRPVEKVAYKVYSEILEGFLWIVDTDKDMHALRAKGIKEVVFTSHEIEELKKLPDKEALKDIYEIKEIFDSSAIIETFRVSDSRGQLDASTSIRGRQKGQTGAGGAISHEI